MGLLTRLGVPFSTNILPRWGKKPNIFFISPFLGLMIELPRISYNPITPSGLNEKMIVTFRIAGILVFDKA